MWVTGHIFLTFDTRFEFTDQVAVRNDIPVDKMKKIMSTHISLTVRSQVKFFETFDHIFDLGDLLAVRNDIPTDKMRQKIMAPIFS